MRRGWRYRSAGPADARIREREELPMSLRGAASIIGIGELKPERRKPGRTGPGLAQEAARLCIEDSGLLKEQVDGLITEIPFLNTCEFAETLGIQPTWAHGVNMMGSSGPTSVAIAAMAVSAGLANNVLCLVTSGEVGGLRRRWRRRHRRAVPAVGGPVRSRPRRELLVRAGRQPLQARVRPHRRGASRDCRAAARERPGEPGGRLLRHAGHHRRHPQLAHGRQPADPARVRDAHARRGRADGEPPGGRGVLPARPPSTSSAWATRWTAACRASPTWTA